MRLNNLAAASLLLRAGACLESFQDRVSGCVNRHSSGSHPAPSKNVYQTSFDGVTWDQDNWMLSTTELQQGAFESRASVANGYLGINVAGAGPFFELDSDEPGGVINGWPLFSRRQTFATIAGFWDSQPLTEGRNFPWLSQYGGDSAISGVPHWGGLLLDLGNGEILDADVDAETISDFQSTYDFKAGVMTWSYKWTPASRKKTGPIGITYRLFAHKLNVNQAVVDLEIVAPKGAHSLSATVASVLDGYSAVRTDFVGSGRDGDSIYSAVRPVGIADVEAYVYAQISGSHGVDMSRKRLVSSHGSPYVRSNDSSVVETVPVSVSAGQTVRVTKFVGAASSDAFPDPRSTARTAVLDAAKAGFDALLKSHAAEWAEVLPEDSVDSFADPETNKLPQDDILVTDAIMAVVNTFYLLQNTVGKNAIEAACDAPLNVDSISVGGLASDSYAGQVFWDADLFMGPGLFTSHPDAAQRISNYRVKLYDQAKANAQTGFTSSQNETHIPAEAAAYAWMSGRFGNCTATGPCFDYEYHLNGDIGLSFVNQWVVSGDTEYFKETLFPIYDSMATLYASLLKRNGSYWTLTNMTDPDEYANNVDAGGFTMPLIAEMLRNANSFRQQFGLPQNETWNEMAENVLTLRENGVTLEFTTMNNSAVVKQADVIMLTFPLSYTDNYTTENSLNDLDYYALEQSPDGPAMTYAYFSIIANQISPSGCSAYTYAQNAFLPYLRGPWFQLSEQQVDNATINGGTHPAYPFLTGHGGANQVVIFGYLGLRLLPDDILHINPNLPPQVPYVRYRDFFWRGHAISAWSNATHTTLSRAARTTPLDTADARFDTSPITIYVGDADHPTVYKLPPKGSVVVPNRQAGFVATKEGNLVQCKPAISHDDIMPGQFPIAAIDGASSTKWQPASADKLSSMTVSFDKRDVGSLVSGFYFEWAQAPPVNATVVFHDELLSTSGKIPSGKGIVAQLSNIKPSKPFNVTAAQLDIIAMPESNTTEVTLKHPVPATRYASLYIIGNQKLSAADVEAKNGTGATVAEWAILGEEKEGCGPKRLI
ncbi:Acid trehalase [Escovopsis weberi]|uniref:alpha,alpha-trehalase n=1 Tax=Escovopsis weberi TaxID=150374 RepID=A0A0M8N6F5_ESCWE|nr:Acid trehalase [Escovopsis weberi]